MDEKSLISEAMRILGSRTSKKKKRACRRNGRRPKRKRKHVTCQPLAK